VARVDGPLDPTWEYRLVLGNQWVPLEPDRGGLSGPQPEELPAGRTAFGLLEARTQTGETIRSGKRWIDDLRRLHQSSTSRDMARSLDRLRLPASEREDQEVQRDLARLAHSLLHDPSAIPDPLSTRSRKKKDESATKAPPVDPTTLIRSLRDRVVPLTHPTSGKDATGGLAFTGIFRALFGGLGDVEDEHEVVPEDLDSLNGHSVEDTNGGKAPSPATDPPAGTKSPKSDPTPVREKNRQRFEKHLDAFVEELASDRFREHATASQMVHAVAYPFAATAMGLRRGWTTPERARGWLVGAARLLLEPSFDGRPPLLKEVRSRYAGERADLFEQIVGDGTLWVTLSAGLVAIRWPGPDAALQRMLLIRTLWNTETLRSRADAAQLDRLIRDYDPGDAVAAIADVAAPVTSSLDRVESRLGVLIEEGLLELQEDAFIQIQPGELLWSPKSGWAVATEAQTGRNVKVYWPKKGEETKVSLKIGKFVSLPQAAQADNELAHASDALLDLFVGHLEA
jgi:hypothetical protein